MNKKRRAVFIILAAALLFWSCDYGQIGGADQTDTYHPEDDVFAERMGLLSGVWYSYDPYTNDLMDGYRIRKWSDFDNADKIRAQSLFSDISFAANNPKTYSTQDVPQNGDYVLLYDASPGETAGYGLEYMGKVKAINIFNGDKNRGTIIIEYFEAADPLWLSQTQGLTRGEKPFFGIYYRVLNRNSVQMANATDLAAMYAGKNYYTEKGTLNEAIKAFDVENEAEFITWGVAFPQIRAKE